MLGKLDEKESKLKQHLAALEEQQAHWLQSAEDLKKREKLVHEWNVSYLAREKEADEVNAKISAARIELEKRAYSVTDSEEHLSSRERELADKNRILEAHQAKLLEDERAAILTVDKLNAEQVGEHVVLMNGCVMPLGRESMIV